MRGLLRTSLATFLLLIATACAANTPTAECETATIEEEIRQWIAGIQDYELQARISFEGREADSSITGIHPDRLRMQLEMTTPSGQTIQTVVFDGKYQWIESRYPSSTQVSRITLAELTTPARPFDTSYYLMGTGLLNGEGFPETMAILLSVYNLEASCSDEYVTLSGPINIPSFNAYAAGRRPQGQPSIMEGFITKFGHLQIEFARDGYEISGYVMGPSEAEPALTVDFQDVRTNEGLGAGVFDYSPPPGIQPEDITEAVKNEGLDN